MKATVEEFQDVKLQRGIWTIDRYVNYIKTITETKDGKTTVSVETHVIKRKDVVDNEEIYNLWHLDNWTKKEMGMIVDYYLSIQ